MIKVLTILRGVSGAGKTSLAETLTQLPYTTSISADDFWYVEGEYVFDVKRLGEAHKWCRCKVENLMSTEECNIVLHNTNTSETEIIPYLELADKYCYKVISLIVENRHGGENVHNVPTAALERQERKLRNSIKLK